MVTIGLYTMRLGKVADHAVREGDAGWDRQLPDRERSGLSKVAFRRRGTCAKGLNNASRSGVAISLMTGSDPMAEAA